jgi:hypothetical protein
VQEECVPFAAEGEPCGAEIAPTCAPHLSCIPVDEEASAYTCSGQVDVGEPCDKAFHCKLGGWCNLDAGKCEASLGLGDPCDDIVQCGATLLCDTNATCQPDAGCYR